MFKPLPRLFYVILSLGPGVIFFKIINKIKNHCNFLYFKFGILISYDFPIIRFQNHKFIFYQGSYDFSQLSSADKASILSKASKAADGIFSINNQTIQFPLIGNKRILGYDPIGKKIWKSGSVFKPINFIDADIRYPWEASRFHHLIWYAQSYNLTRDDKWVIQGLKDIRDFNNEDIFGYGINWRDGLQLSIRIFSIVGFLDLIGESNFSKGQLKELKDFFSKNFYLLEKQISPKSDFRNNHSIGEFSGLIVGSLLIGDELKLKKYLSLLRKELEIQIYDDGIPFEGSLPYIIFDLDFLIFITIALKNSNLDIDITWLEKITKNSYISLSKISGTKDFIIPLGDGDEGRVFKLGEQDYLRCTQELMLAREIFQDERIKFCNQSEIGLYFWVTGQENPLSLEKDSSLHIFQDSGLIKFKFFDLDILIDNGPTGLGENGIGGHGHNDTSSLFIYDDDLGILCDCGWYTYYLDDETRYELQSTSSHNTIKVDGNEQSRIIGRFSILNDCEPRNQIIQEDNISIKINLSHSGFKRLKKGVEVIRELIFDKKEFNISIIDKVSSAKPVEVQGFFNSEDHEAIKEGINITLFKKYKLTTLSETIINEKRMSKKNGELFFGSNISYAFTNEDKNKRFYAFAETQITHL